MRLLELVKLRETTAARTHWGAEWAVPFERMEFEMEDKLDAPPDAAPVFEGAEEARVCGSPLKA